MNWAKATRAQTATARQTDALAGIDTTSHVIRDGGIDYIVRVVDGLARKPRSNSPKPDDPFAPPYEPALYVDDIAPAHAGLLNKFPVLSNHLLIVTRDYRPQTGVLDVADFEALLNVLSGWDGLAFYNGGPEAGASQPHRHLQVVDPPLASANSQLPVTDALEAAVFDGDIGHSEALAFPHAIARMPRDALAKSSAGAARVKELYLKLLDAIGRPATSDADPGAYNVLATRGWLWAVPRTRAEHDGIEVNALGFAGGMLAANTDQLERLRSTGPAHWLQSVCPRTMTTR